jgi:hypothetical protein
VATKVINYCCCDWVIRVETNDWPICPRFHHDEAVCVRTHLGARTPDHEMPSRFAHLIPC